MQRPSIIPGAGAIIAAVLAGSLLVACGSGSKPTTALATSPAAAAPSISCPSSASRKAEAVGIKTSVWLRSDAGTGPFDDLVNHARYICFASPFAYRVDAGPQKLVSLLSADQTAKLKEAQHAGVQIMPTIVDTDAAGTWGHPEVAAGILRDPKVLIQQAVAVAMHEGYTGFDIDWESIPQAASGAVGGWTSERVLELSPRFTAFVQKFAAALHAHGKILSVSVISRTGVKDWEGAAFFDYHALGAAADQVRLMAYDEHWGTSPAGPTASLTFVHVRLDYALTQIPPGKVWLGIPWYGYVYGSKRRDPSLTFSQAQAIVPDPGTVRRVGAEVTYTSAGMTVWFNDACSTEQRMEDLAAWLKQNNLHASQIGGVAVYPIGDESPQQWPALAGQPFNTADGCIGGVA